jgi:hypothetical protein
MLEIISPLTGEKLQVAQNDFEHKMDWHEAKKACQNLGNGWRLPSIKELELIDKEFRQKGIGNFQKFWYWSGTEGEVNSWFESFFYRGSITAWRFAFHDGGPAEYYKSLRSNDSAKCCVRAVRPISGM